MSCSHTAIRTQQIHDRDKARCAIHLTLMLRRHRHLHRTHSFSTNVLSTVTTVVSTHEIHSQHSPHKHVPPIEQQLPRIFIDDDSHTLHRLPRRPRLPRPRTVGRTRPGALRLPVYVVNGNVQVSEEIDDVLGQRGAAREGEAALVKA